MTDLTIIFLTVNKVPEQWAEYHKKVLMEAIGDSPLITVSRLPMDGVNLIQDEISVPNIYKQMLRAAKIAETEFVAIAEDDTLYHKDHFAYRPKGKFLYNMSRWGILSWRTPIYFYRHRESNSALIAPRKLLIECLEQYNGGYGEVGKERVMKKMGLDYKADRFHSRIPIINFHHINGIDGLEQRLRKTNQKSLLAIEVPYWGRAEDLIKKFI
jgi:hypothetical protein